MPYDVVLVDDQKIMRDGIKAILKNHDDFRVVAETDDGADAVQICRKNKPHLVIIDIPLPRLNGIEATGEIIRYCPETKVIILSMYDDEDSVVSAIRSGARAFVLKKASDNDLLDALRTVARGGSYLSPQVSDRLLNRIKRDLEARKMPQALEGLSPRELQVLRLVAEGKTSKEIAVLLDLGLQTVRSYRMTMMAKLNVSSLAGLRHLASTAAMAVPSVEPIAGMTLTEFLGQQRVAIRRHESANIASNVYEMSRVQGLRVPQGVRERAVSVFGDEKKASHWLETPLAILDYQSPAEVAAEPGGIERVERILTRIEHNIPS